MTTKIKIPPKITIGCHTYKLFRAGDEELVGFDGTAAHRAELLYIAKSLPITRQNTAFVHECLHTIIRVWDIKELMGEDAEGVINRLDEGLGELLFNNLGIEFDWSDIKDLKLTPIESKDDDQG